jgi:phenylacetate-CoA ligase
MLIINGVNIFPSQIEEVLLRTKGVGANYLIVVEKDGVLDRMTVKVEITPEMFADDTRIINALRERIRDELTALITIRPVVEIKQPGSLPVAEGKAKRVEDLRID